MGKCSAAHGYEDRNESPTPKASHERSTVRRIGPYNAPMAQTLTRLLVHVVFSTKERRNLIPPEVAPELHAYLGGICRNRESPARAIGGTENHVHLLVSLSKNIALSDLMMTLKKDSSKWIKTKKDAYADFQLSDFAWRPAEQALACGVWAGRTFERCDGWRRAAFRSCVWAWA